MPVDSEPFGRLPCGEEATLFTLANERGTTARITDYGAILVGLDAPGPDGRFDDVVLGKAAAEGYAAGHPHFGAIAGRTAGRIAGARFTLDGVEHRLAANDPPNNLHGGPEGFDKKLWRAETTRATSGEPSLRLALRSPDGDQGFPGNVDAEVRYTLTAGDALRIDYRAATDRATPLNLTNHAYFNLKGEAAGDIRDHWIRIDAADYAPVDERNTPLGRRAPVVPGQNDFRHGLRLADLDDLSNRNADNHYFLPGGRAAEPRQAAEAVCEPAGRRMEVHTTEPGLQFYAATALDGEHVGKSGAPYGRFAGLCFETQEYPDAIHAPELGDIVLRPGRPHASTTIFRFFAL